MTLLSSELRRVSSRRLTRATLVVGGLALAAAGAVTFVQHSASVPDMALATQLADDNHQSCLADLSGSGMTTTEIEDNCFMDPMWFVEDNNFYLAGVVHGLGDAPWTDVRAEVTTRTVIEEGNTGLEGPAWGFSGSLAAFGSVVALTGAMLGASYVGADWKSGVIESQLVRQPNRPRLMAAKIASSGIVVSAMAVLFSTAFVAVMVPSAIWRGGFRGTGPAFWTDVALMVGRISLSAALLAMLAAAAAMLARSTVAGVVAVLAGYIATGIIGGIGGSFASMIALPQNLASWIGLGDVTRDVTGELQTGGYYEVWTVPGHSWVIAGALLIAAAVLANATAAGAFHRRDVS